MPSPPSSGPMQGLLVTLDRVERHLQTRQEKQLMMTVLNSDIGDMDYYIASPVSTHEKETSPVSMSRAQSPDQTQEPGEKDVDVAMAHTEGEGESERERCLPIRRNGLTICLPAIDPHDISHPQPCHIIPSLNMPRLPSVLSSWNLFQLTDHTPAGDSSHLNLGEQQDSSSKSRQPHLSQGLDVIYQHYRPLTSPFHEIPSISTHQHSSHFHPYRCE